MGKFDAKELLENALNDTQIDLGPLVAATALWAAPEVHKYLVSLNGSGAWRPNVRRARSGETRRTVVNDVLLDDNTLANKYLKVAIGVLGSKLVGFETCHIWPSTCYDPLDHTTIANLVLIPRALASLSDHSDSISAILKYRAFELYDWHPKNESAPERPDKYPNNWRKPFSYTERVQKSVKRRSWQ